MVQNRDEKKLSAAVLAPGPGDDGGWSQSAIEAGEALRQHNWQVVTLPNVPPDLALEAAKDLCRKGTDLIIGHGCEYFEAFEQLAPGFPQTYFFVMDRLMDRETWPANFCCLYQRQDEAIYLCGRLAAHLTGSKKVGFVGGMEVPTQLANGRAFEHGARSLDPAVEVLSRYAGSFEAPGLGKAIALEMIDGGVDVFMHSASETGNGVIEACKERSVSVIGYVLDQSRLAPEAVAASMILDVSRIYRSKAQEVAEGSFRSGVWQVGVADGMVDVARFREDIPAPVLEDIDRARRGIVSGSIIV